LVQALIPEYTENKSNAKSPALKNLVHISLQIHELILSPNSIDELSESEPSTRFSDVNESLLNWIKRKNCLRYEKDFDSPEILVWGEWSLLV
jgi:hypothetical protein